MRAVLEALVWLGGGILVWGKLGSIALSLALVFYGCYRFNKLLKRIHLLRSTTTCQ